MITKIIHIGLIFVKITPYLDISSLCKKKLIAVGCYENVNISEATHKEECIQISDQITKNYKFYKN